MPVRGSLTSETQLHITFAPVSGSDTGGSPLTEYAVFIDDTEYLTGSTNLEYTHSASSGTSYKVEYAGVNRQGTGALSPSETIKAITVPGKVSQPSVSYASGAYTVDWSAPTTGGTGVALTQYIVEIQKSDGYFDSHTDCPGSDVSLITCDF